MEREEDSQRWLIVRVGDRSYGLPTACVEEIVPYAELTEAPGTPPSLKGFLDVGGELTAAVSLRRLWGMPDTPPELYTPLVLLKPRPERIALVVDGVARILDLRRERAVEIAEGCCVNDCATGVARLPSGSVVLLDPDRFLLEQERRRVAELAELTQQRLSLVGEGSGEL